MKLHVAGVCAAALWFSPAGIADPHSPVNTSSFHSLATVQATVTPRASCEGTDGIYTLLHVVGSGPVTSNDPRMAGIFNANAYILDSPTTSLGVSRDDWTITDPATGAVKAHGMAIATDFAGTPRAVTFGRLADGSHMVANAQVTLPAPGTTDPILIEYGGPAPTTPDRGVIMAGRNKCIDFLFSTIDGDQ
jgi:hypothetical protein